MSGTFESMRWNASVHRLDLSLYSHQKEFWGNGVSTHVNSKGKIPSPGKILPIGGSNPRGRIKQDSEPNTLPTSGAGIAQLVVLGLAVHSVAGSIFHWGHFP